MGNDMANESTPLFDRVIAKLGNPVPAEPIDRSYEKIVEIAEASRGCGSRRGGPRPRLLYPHPRSRPTPPRLSRAESAYRFPAHHPINRVVRWCMFGVTFRVGGENHPGCELSPVAG